MGLWGPAGDTADTETAVEPVFPTLLRRNSLDSVTSSASRFSRAFSSQSGTTASKDEPAEDGPRAVLRKRKSSIGSIEVNLAELYASYDFNMEHEKFGTGLRSFCFTLINSTKFGMGIGLLICVNTFLMGVELDQHPLATRNDVMISYATVRGVPQEFFDSFELFFFVIFSVEFLLRMLVYRFIMLLEVSTYIDLAALSPVVLIWAFDLNGSKQLTLLRIVRLLKLCRLLRLIRLFKELHVLASSMASAARALVWIGLLLLIAVYCAAIACTLLIGHNTAYLPTDPKIMEWEEKYDQEVDVMRYWGSVMRSMFTLFQIFTLDDWAEVVRPVIETHQPLMLVFFVAFLFITTFGLLNLLMGTIVDRAMSVARETEEEKQKILREDHKQVMLVAVRLFSLADSDGNGRLSSKELETFMRENDVPTLLEKHLKGFKINIDYQDLLDICQNIVDDWHDADNEEEDGITLEEFAGAAIRLQGQAKSKDLLTVMMLQKTMNCHIQFCDKMIKDVRHKVDDEFQLQSLKLDRLLRLLGDGSDNPKLGAEYLKHSFCNVPEVPASAEELLVDGPPRLTAGLQMGQISESELLEPEVRFTGTFQSVISDDVLLEHTESRKDGGLMDNETCLLTLEGDAPGRLDRSRHPNQSLSCQQLRQAPSSSTAFTQAGVLPVDAAKQIPGSLRTFRSEHTVQQRITWDGAHDLQPRSHADSEARLFHAAPLCHPIVPAPRLLESSAAVATHSLRSERGDLQRSGHRVTALLKQIANNDEFASTDAVSGLREYSTRRRTGMARSPDQEEKSASTSRGMGRINSASINSTALEFARHTFGGVFGSRTGISRADFETSSSVMPAQDISHKPPVCDVPKMGQAQGDELFVNDTPHSLSSVPC